MLIYFDKNNLYCNNKVIPIIDYKINPENINNLFNTVFNMKIKILSIKFLNNYTLMVNNKYTIKCNTPKKKLFYKNFNSLISVINYLKYSTVHKLSDIKIYCHPNGYINYYNRIKNIIINEDTYLNMINLEKLKNYFN